MITSRGGLPDVGSICYRTWRRLQVHLPDKSQGRTNASIIHVDQPDCRIKMLECYLCSSLDELRQREQYLMEKVGNVGNRNKAFMTSL